MFRGVLMSALACVYDFWCLRCYSTHTFVKHVCTSFSPPACVSGFKSKQKHSGSVPVLHSGHPHLFPALLEHLLVLVDKVLLHLGHLSHDLLPAQPGHLGLPLPFCFFLFSHELHQTEPHKPWSTAGTFMYLYAMHSANVWPRAHPGWQECWRLKMFVLWSSWYFLWSVEKISIWALECKKLTNTNSIMRRALWWRGKPSVSWRRFSVCGDLFVFLCVRHPVCWHSLWGSRWSYPYELPGEGRSEAFPTKPGYFLKKWELPPDLNTAQSQSCMFVCRHVDKAADYCGSLTYIMVQEHSAISTSFKVLQTVCFFNGKYDVNNFTKWKSWAFCNDHLWIYCLMKRKTLLVY